MDTLIFGRKTSHLRVKKKHNRCGEIDGGGLKDEIVINITSENMLCEHKDGKTNSLKMINLYRDNTRKTVLLQVKIKRSKTMKIPFRNQCNRTGS